MKRGLKRGLLPACFAAAFLLCLAPRVGARGEPDVGGRALLDQGVAAARAGNFEKALGTLAAARDLCDAAGDTYGAAWARSWIADCLSATGKTAEALSLFEEALGLMQAAHGGPDHPDVAFLHTRIASILFLAGRAEEALPHYAKALNIRRKVHGDLADVVAGSAELTGRCLATLGRHEEALKLFRNALAIRKSLLPEGAVEYVNALGSLGGYLMELGRHEEALPLWESRLGLMVEGGGERYLTAADAHHAASICLMHMGRAAEALPRLETALGIAREYGEDGESLVYAILDDLGDCLDALGRPEEAVGRFREALELVERRTRDSPEAPVRIGATEKLASALRDLGRFREALPFYEALLELRRRRFPGDHPEAARAMNDLAAALENLGRYPEALSHLRAAERMQERLHEGDHAGVALARNNLGLCLAEMGRPAEALPLHERALAMLERLGETGSRSAAACMSNLGRCLEELGRPEEALPRYASALETLGALGDEYAVDRAKVLNNRAGCLAALGRFDEALPLYVRSLTSFRDALSWEHPLTALALGNLGFCLRRLGFPREALLLHDWALREIDTGPVVLQNLVNRALCLSELGRAAEAIESAEEAAALSDRLVHPAGHLVRAILGWMRLDLAVDAKGAAREFGDAIARVEEMRSSAATLDEGDRSTYFEYLRRHDPFRGMVESMLRLSRLGEAVRYLEKGRSRGFLDLLARSRFDPIREIRLQARDAEDEELLARIREVEEALADGEAETARLTREAAVLRGRTDLDRSEWESRLEELGGELAAARSARREALRRRARLVGEQLPIAGTADAGDLRRLLREGEVLLLYSLGSRGGLCFVVPPAGREIRAHRLAWPDGSPVDSASAEEAVDAYLDSVRVTGDPARGLGGLDRGAESLRAQKRAVTLGHRLFRALLPPEAWAEVEGASRVYLVPDGRLHRLPFEALVVEPGEDAERCEYLLDRGPEIVYGPSASALMWCRRRRDAQLRSPRAAGALALGDPVYRRDGATTGLAPLPGTRAEAKAMAAALAHGEEPIRVTELLGEDARKSKLESLAPRARYLHLATHHIADERDRASYSALALTLPENPGTGDDGDDGFLRLIDLLEHWRGKLTRCELVVLSACETHRGDLQRDEGVFAMPWGFMYAGCPSVIASQWPVSDASTAELMSDFYARLAKGETKLAAFTAARKALRERWPEPWHWAPFVYIGDPR